MPEIVNVTIPDLENWLTKEFDDQSANPLRSSSRRSKSHLYINNEIVKSLKTPQHSTRICNYAFTGCSSIQDVTISDEVASIGNEAFSFCKNLSKAVIGNGVKVIFESAFEGCKKLEVIYIGENVTTIDRNAFYNVPGNEVHCLGQTPPSIDTDQFNSRDKSKATLYVPKGSYQAYYLSNWGSIFTNIIEMEE